MVALVCSCTVLYCIVFVLLFSVCLTDFLSHRVCPVSGLGSTSVSTPNPPVVFLIFPYTAGYCVTMALRPIDLLPPYFDGDILDHELSTSWFMSFTDYLRSHNLHQPADDAALQNVIRLFKCRLTKHARIWAEDRHFANIDDIRTQFLARFSPTHSEFANVKFFEDIKYKPGDTAHQHLCHIRMAAARIGYNEAQIRNKLLQTLPPDCQRAVIMSIQPDADANAVADAAQRFLDLCPKTPTVSFQTQNQDQVFAAQLHDVITRLDALDAKMDAAHHARPNPDDENEGHAYSRSPRPERRTAPSPRRRRSRDRYDSEDRRRDAYARYDSQDRRHDAYARSSSRDRGRPVYSRRPNCHFCGKPGHFWRYCFRLQQQMSTGALPPDYVPPAARTSRYGSYGNDQGGYRPYDEQQYRQRQDFH